MAAADAQQSADAAMNGAARNLTTNPAFVQLPRLATPLKRSRSRAEESVTERISGDLARTSTEGLVDAAEMDNLRSQKRFLSESMAADMSKMSCAGGGGLLLGCGSLPDGGSQSDDSPGSPMATDRRTSGGSAITPEAAGCFSPFGTPAERRPARLSGGGEAGPVHLRASSGGAQQDSAASAASIAAVSPATPQRSGPVSSTTGFLTPSPTRTRMSRGGACTAMDASEAERLPPSPSDPALGQDLRRTALLRSLLQRTEDRAPAATPMHSRHKPVGELTAFAAEQHRRQQKLAADMAASHAAHQQEQAQRGELATAAPPQGPMPQAQGNGTGGAQDMPSSGISRLAPAADADAGAVGFGRQPEALSSIPEGQQASHAGEQQRRQLPSAAPELPMHSPPSEAPAGVWAVRRSGGVVNPFARSAPTTGLLGTSPSFNGSMSMDFSAMDASASSSDSEGQGWPAQGHNVRDLGRSMSVSSVPTNGVNGGIFAFEEEPTGVAGSNRPLQAVSAADSAHRRHAEALSGGSGPAALPQLSQQQPSQRILR